LVGFYKPIIAKCPKTKERSTARIVERVKDAHLSRAGDRQNINNPIIITKRIFQSLKAKEPAQALSTAKPIGWVAFERLTMSSTIISGRAE